MNRLVLLGAVVGVLTVSGNGVSAPVKPPVPDFTRDGEKGKSLDWALGPTGARGWIWGWRGQTTDARQILVTAVDGGSPADGILREGDVLLGVNGEQFSSDARIGFARAITESEKLENRGILRVLRWRDGVTDKVVIELPVMGSYSATAPYGCDKSRRILEQGCRAIAEKGLDKVSIPNDLNALALLASGDDQYRPVVAEYARKVADYHPGGLECWHYAYATLFLAEYVLSGADEVATEGLRRLALDIARGQSGVGTWGHRFARSDGILNGYGAMNQPGIVLTLGMVLAREAGIEDPDLDSAIGKASRFLRWYVNKGAVPYGDHPPWPWHEDNGKCSAAAVLFDLLGDKEAAGFFSRMGTAAHAERESGHTGNFFNILWALPGVSRCGPLAVGAYMEKTSWYYDLARRWDGSFLYQGTPGDWGGKSYRNWDATGAFLLAYALPLRKLYLTGRKPGAAPILSAEETARVISAGNDFTFWTKDACYDDKDLESLFEGLTSWSPAVRKRSAQALGRREGEFVPRLLELLDSGDMNARYGACEALGCLGPRSDAAAPRVRALLEEDDPWTLILAVGALVRMGPEVRQSTVPDLLTLSVRRNDRDPREMVQRAISTALFSPLPGKSEPDSILRDSLEGVNRELLYPAVKAVLENEDGATRGLLKSVYNGLNDRDIVALLPFIIKAIQEPAPSNQMFADSIRLAGVDLLTRLHISEAMVMSVELMEPERWGGKRRIPQCLKCLARYGSHAKAMIPRLREAREALVRRNPRQGEKHELVVAVDKAIEDIEADTAEPSLVSMKELVRDPEPTLPLRKN